MDDKGRVVRVNGPLVDVENLEDVMMSEIVELGDRALPAEVVAIDRGRVSLQAYEYTGGLAPGDKASSSGRALSAYLGPWLLGGVFDGLLRPLHGASTWLGPGDLRASSDEAWTWRPLAKSGEPVSGGSPLGTVDVPGALEYRVLVPPSVSGEIASIEAEGDYRADDPIASVGGVEVCISSRWPVRRPLPVRERLDLEEPLLTGQRVLDTLFPLARGGTAAVPGGFGTGKTLLLQQVAKWCDADVIVYVGCGERGNEMADVLDEFADLTDPHTGGRLADRTVIIANTSNMPMMARESSVYSGMTVAEHFRDMGYHTVVIADSTSRWAEALREFASRSGAMPAEEGYPADLASALAAFYERSGAVVTLGGTRASVTVIGAVSPPGGDFTEPVTSQTQRFVRGLWTLDHDLAYARHYPAVSWSGSFARDAETIGAWYSRQGDSGWSVRRAKMTALLAEADRLGAFAELVGATSLPDRERAVLVGGRLLREGVLQQSAIVPNDAYCSAAKAAALADAVLDVAVQCEELAAAGTPAAQLEAFDFSSLLRAGPDVAPGEVAEIGRRRTATLAALKALAP